MTRGLGLPGVGRPQGGLALIAVLLVLALLLTVVGEFTEGPPTVSIKDGETLQPLEAHSHDHFKSRGLMRPSR